MLAKAHVTKANLAVLKKMHLTPIQIKALGVAYRTAQQIAGAEGSDKQLTAAEIASVVKVKLTVAQVAALGYANMTVAQIEAIAKADLTAAQLAALGGRGTAPRRRPPSKERSVLTEEPPVRDVKTEPMPGPEDGATTTSPDSASPSPHGRPQHSGCSATPLTASIAAMGAAMVSLIDHAHDSRTPVATAWVLCTGAAVANCSSVRPFPRRRPASGSVPHGLPLFSSA